MEGGEQTCIMSDLFGGVPVDHHGSEGGEWVVERWMEEKCWLFIGLGVNEVRLDTLSCYGLHLSCQ
jgi:hypothetical protein